MGDAIPTEPPDGGAPYANRTVTQVAGAVASPGTGPAGGSVAAIAGALAASLVQLAATVSREWPEAAATRERASQLEGRLLALADADAAAWVYALRHGESAEARLNARTVPPRSPPPRSRSNDWQRLQWRARAARPRRRHDRRPARPCGPASRTRSRRRERAR